jgi:alkanesulfonate monooxygenase SsuD/methylene tetrahydromethanopterin reductase-like flavin-dependent oxidoreductase (luciferase family)
VAHRFRAEGVDRRRGGQDPHAREESRRLTNALRLGIVYTADRPPEGIARFAAATEAAGLDELWLWEDCFLAGGIAATATALAATQRITVGLGVMPAVFRNAAASAMEIATLARIHPGRFVAGIGHGVPAWMEQIGALPAKPVRALEETTIAVRRLLAGERVTTDGDYVRLRDVQLDHAPAVVPPVLLGVRRPFGLRAAGRSADGTILAEPSPPAYVRWARQHVDEGRAAAGRSDPHRTTVYVKGRVDPDRRHVRRVLGRMVLDESVAAQLAALGRDPELAGLRALADPDLVAGALPDDLVDELAAAGTPDQVAASLGALADAGADSIAFVPVGPDPDEQLRLLAETIAPGVRGSR